MAQEMPSSKLSSTGPIEHHQNSSNEASDSTQIQLPFPPEVIVLILQHLNVFQLQQVRLTCRHFKTIIDNSSILLRKFCLSLPNGFLDESCEPACLLPVSHVFINCARIVSFDPWRSVLGENLAKLSILNSKFSLPNLAEVLRRTPNLNELDLFCNQYPTNVDIYQFANFQLDHLRQIKLHDHFDKLIQLLQRICPRPQSLECNADDVEQQAIEYLQTAQDSLQRVKIFATDPILTAMSQLPRLRLKTVILGCMLTTSEKMLQFVQAQPTIETLGLEDMEFSNAVIYEIGRNLPNLRHLKIDLLSINTSAGIWRPTFLATMPHLVYLWIDADLVDNVQATFEEYKSPYLEELILAGFKFESSNAIGHYLRHSPNLNKLVIQNTNIAAESDLFANLPLSRLHTLILFRVTSYLKDECLVEKLENLRVLELNEIDMIDLKSALIRLSPQLESVRISKLALTDQWVLEMCQTLKRLKKLSLHRCWGVTDASVEHIIGHCHVLEQVHVSHCFHLSKEAKTRLKAIGRYEFKPILNHNKFFVW